jgi:hypothetical protein
VHVVPRPCKTTGDPSLSSMFAEVIHVVVAEVATDATAPNTATRRAEQLAASRHSRAPEKVAHGPPLKIHVFEKRVPMNRCIPAQRLFSSQLPSRRRGLARGSS